MLAWLMAAEMAVCSGAPAIGPLHLWRGVARLCSQNADDLAEALPKDALARQQILEECWQLRSSLDSLFGEHWPSADLIAPGSGPPTIPAVAPGFMHRTSATRNIFARAADFARGLGFEQVQLRHLALTIIEWQVLTGGADGRHGT